MKKVFLQYNPISHLPAEYQQRMWDIADFYQQLPFDHNFIMRRTTDLDQAFDELLDVDPDWVVVVSLGHCSLNRGIYDECITSAQDLGVSLLGHLLNFPDQYPHIHPQLFVVDYQAWLQLDEPKWNYTSGEESFTSIGYEASEETFHDDYTPYRIRGNGETQRFQVKEMQTGSRMLRALFENSKHAHNIMDLQRQAKFHLYPDQDWEEFNAFLNGSEYAGTNSAQQHYCELMGHLNRQVQKQYYVLNTEPLTSIATTHPIDHYVGVASGLKLFCQMAKNGFDSSTLVTYIDFSPVALQFQRALIKNWDGDFATYQEHCTRFQRATPGYYPCLPSGPWETNYQYILKELNFTENQFMEEWGRFKFEVEHCFIEIDLYQDQGQDALVELLACLPYTYLWISNAFYMEYSLVRYGKAHLYERRQRLFDQIAALDVTVTVDSQDFWNQGLITFNNRITPDTSS